MPARPYPGSAAPARRPPCRGRARPRARRSGSPWPPLGCWDMPYRARCCGWLRQVHSPIR